MIGWLRAAYLIAFTAWGYQYILIQALDCVREQIRTPAVALIESFSVVVPKASPQERQLVLLEEPAEIRSLIVWMGAVIVFLPEPGSNQLDFYKHIETELARLGGRAKCKGKRIPSAETTRLCTGLSRCG